MIARLSRYLLVCVAAGFVSTSGSLQAKESFDNDFRLWNEFMVHEYKGEDWSTYTWGELRWSDDASDFTTWFVQQKVYTMLFPWLQVGGGAAYIRTDSATSGWITMYRGEYEINPKAKIGDKISLTLRNRLENRRWETRDYNDEWLSRHRLQLIWKTSWMPQMTKFEAFNEWFYDYRLNQSTENRFRPINLHFEVNEYVSMNLFFQVRSRRGNNEDSWNNAYIAGTGLRFYPSKMW